MQPRLSIVITLSFVIFLGFALPVSALYFDFSYFETDQMTYEVGETINMVTELVADFSEEGWCHVSFLVATDQGLVYDDSFFISPSPNTRLITSKYTILPEHTSPYPDPVVAQISLNVEIFDKYYQGINEIIEVNITRGHLQVQSNGPLSIQTNANATLDFIVTSMYNQSIPLASEPSLIEIFNSTNDLVFSNITTTTPSGNLVQHWNQTPFLPGDYSIQVSGNGSNAFLPFSETFPLLVNSEPSTLTRIDTVENLYCQTPSGLFYEDAHVVFQHNDSSMAPISDSNITWVTSFGNGILAQSIVGQYEGIIPFQTTPGQYQVNVTASHYGYQDAMESFVVDVLPRTLNISASMKQILPSYSLKIDVNAKDWIEAEPIDSIPINITIFLNEWQFSLYAMTNSTGQVSCSIQIPEDKWGTGTVSISAESSTFYSYANSVIPIDIVFEPTILIHDYSEFVRAYQSYLNISIEDPSGLRITNISVLVQDSEGNTLAIGSTDSFGFLFIEWTVGNDTPIGYNNLTIRIQPNTCFVAEVSDQFQVYVKYPLWITSSNSSWVFVRGNYSDVSLTIESELGISDMITVNFLLSTGEILDQASLLVGTLNNLSLYISSSVPKGIYPIEIEILHENYTLVHSFAIETTILVPITSEINNPQAFYSNQFLFELTVYDDTFQPLSSAYIQIFDNVSASLVSDLDIPNLSLPQSIILPEWLLPGMHAIYIDITGNYTTSYRIEISLMIWIRTSLQITINTELDGEMIVQTALETHHLLSSIPVISSGSISNPPPILFNGTTSTESQETRDTSLISCPRFSSGTSNLSTVLEKSFTTLSGNGQRVRNLRDLKEVLLSIMASSTDLEVLPKDTTPHSEVSGPLTTTSVRRSI